MAHYTWVRCWYAHVHNYDDSRKQRLSKQKEEAEAILLQLPFPG